MEVMIILGILGAWAGGVIGYESAKKESKEVQEQITDDKTNLVHEREEDLALAALSWEAQLGAAEDQADDWLYQAGLLKEDSLEYAAQSGALGVKTTKDESILSTVYNQAINDIQLTAEKNQLSNQIASVEQGKSDGSTLAGMAKSGIRSGSSAHDALGNEQALFDKSMEINLTGQSNDLDSTTINSYAYLHNGLNTLTGQRTQQKNLMTQSKRAEEMAGRYETKANDLLSDYAEGGINWQIHQQKVSDMLSDYDFALDTLDKDYERAGMDTWDNFAAFFGGATVGAGAGSNAGEFLKNWDTVFG